METVIHYTMCYIVFLIRIIRTILGVTVHNLMYTTTIAFLCYFSVYTLCINNTYVIGRYNPSVRIIDLVSHTTYVVCVNFLYISGGAYSLKSTPNDRFFEKLFLAILFWHSEFLPEICSEEIAEEILFVFCFDVWPGTRTLAFRLISQHTTY